MKWPKLVVTLPEGSTVPIHMGLVRDNFETHTCTYAAVPLHLVMRWAHLLNWKWSRWRFRRKGRTYSEWLQEQVAVQQERQSQWMKLDSLADKIFDDRAPTATEILTPEALEKIRGRHRLFTGKRPDTIIIDDIENDLMSEDSPITVEKRKKVLDWMEKQSSTKEKEAT